MAFLSSMDNAPCLAVEVMFVSKAEPLNAIIISGTYLCYLFNTLAILFMPYFNAVRCHQ